MNDSVYIMSVGPGFKVEDLFSTVKSCFNQTYPSDLYVFFDGVTLEYEVLEFLELNNVIYFSASQCKGLACRLNFLIDTIVKKNTHKYIFRIDCGDICRPDRTEKQASFLFKNQQIDVVGSGAAIYSNGIFQGDKEVTSSHYDIKSSLRWKNPMIHPSVVFRASALSDKFRYDEKMLRCQDYKFWVDLISGGVFFANINEPLIDFHRDDKFIERRAKSIASFELKARIYAVRKLGSRLGSLYVLAGLIFIFRHLPSSFILLAYRFKQRKPGSGLS